MGVGRRLAASIACVASLAGIARGKTPEKPARFRISYFTASPLDQDCSTGPPLRPGDRLSIVDEHGWQGDVTVGADRPDAFHDAYDGCPGRIVPMTLPKRLAQLARDPGMTVSRTTVLVGPFGERGSLRRARVIDPRPLHKRQEGRHLARVFGPQGPPPGFLPLCTLDLDGDGVVDAEHGLLVCDTRVSIDGDLVRQVTHATRMRDGRRWRYTDLSTEGNEGMMSMPVWTAQEPYSMCPFEPPPPQTEIVPEPGYQPTPPVTSVGMQR